nr:DUF975 family protein [uncultured Peptostreptococcus sp.]
MLSSSEIRALSRKQLKGNWSKFVGINLIALIVGGGSYYLTSVKNLYYVSIIQIIIQMLISVGVYRLSLDIARGRGFKISNFWQPARVYGRYILSTILLSILVILINMLIGVIVGVVGFSMAIGSINPMAIAITGIPKHIIIPLIIAIIIAIFINVYIELAFSLTYLIIVSNHDQVGSIDSLSYSRKLMAGYKWRLFKLSLSFIGWIILSILSLGIGTLWLTTYMSVAVSNFYLEILKEKPELAKEFNLIDSIDDKPQV